MKLNESNHIVTKDGVIRYSFFLQDANKFNDKLKKRIEQVIKEMSAVGLKRLEITR